MTKPPTHVRVGHRRFAFKLVPSSDFGDDSTRGDCWIHGARIRVSNDMQPQDLAETAIHELIHAMWPDRPITGPANIIEEDVAIELGRGFAQVIRDNPALVAWLSHALSGKEL